MCENRAEDETHIARRLADIICHEIGCSEDEK